jgi:putative DNA primase/helicase
MWGADDDIDIDITDDGLATGHRRMAIRLAREHGDSMMHVHGLGWFCWDGTRWAEDGGGKRSRLNVIRVLQKAAAESVGSSKELRTDVARCESASGIEGVLKVAEVLPPFSVPIEALDANPYLLNCANGTLDLETLRLRGHDRHDRLTKVTTGRYVGHPCGPVWGRFLAEVLPDEPVREYLRRYVGLALVGTVLEHLLAILTGSGRNGKGVFYGAVNHALGDYAGVPDPNLFLHREGVHPASEMELRGKRWIVVSENNAGQRLAEATVKRLTGGDTISARRLYGPWVTFQPVHMAALVTNHLPRVSSDDEALWARLRVVPFNVRIAEADQDVHLAETLRTEADAVLSWAVAGWAAYQAGGMAEPDAVKVATDRYHLASDAISRFLEECCLFGPHLTVVPSLLYERWKDWASGEMDVPPMNVTAFGREMTKRGYPVAPDKRVRRGLTLAHYDGGKAS